MNKNFVYFIIFVSFFFSCQRRDLKVLELSKLKLDSNDIVYRMKRYKFLRNQDSIKEYMLFDFRIKYCKIDESTLIIHSVIDSVKRWESSKMADYRDTLGWGEPYASRYDSIIRIIDSSFYSINHTYFYNLGLSKNTKIILLNPIDGNDTLYYECEKIFNNLTVFSYYHHSEAFDGSYRLYLCDSIGEIAFYSGPWNGITMLDRIINADSIDLKWQDLKVKILADSMFFPIPIECIPKRKIKIISQEK